MSVHQLTSQNFSISGRTQKKFLNINLPGAVLVFFKMDSCPGCNSFDPIFHQLAREEVRINYAVINLTSFRDVVTMSRQSTTPIASVPLLLFFINGGPHAKYNGKKHITPMKSFINKALQSAPPPSSVPTQGFMPSAQGGGYGGGGYTQSSQGPQQGHAGYSQHGAPNGNQPKTHMPEIGNAPNMKGVIKGTSGSSSYSYLNDVEEDDDDKLLTPTQVTPYNVPWETHYRKIDGDS